MGPSISRIEPGVSSFLVILILVCSIPVTGHAAWVTKEPPGEAVVAFTVDPNTPSTLFATTAIFGGGVWKSTNSGDSWGGAAVNVADDFRGVAVQPGNSNIVVAGIANTGGGGIQRSVNGGTTWASEGTGAANSWFFSFSVSSPAVVYAGGSVTALGEDGLMLISTDSGDTWIPTSVAGDATPNIISLAVDPTNANIAYAGVIPDGPLNDGLYKTTNGGATWGRLTNLNFTRVDTLAIDPNDSNIIYAGTSGIDEIWRSTDAGSSWTELLDASGAGLGADFRFRGVAIDPDDSRVIYAAGGSSAKVLASVDCGVSWSNVSSTGIVGTPSTLAIDTINNYVYVVEAILSGDLYRETLGAGLAAASGACPGGTPPGNAPVAVDDNVNATEDTQLVAVTDLDNNDTDADFDPLTVVPGTFGTAQGGSITITADGFYTYDPAANFNGIDIVNYTVTDGSLSDSGILTINVGPDDDPPVAVDDAINVAFNTMFVSTVDLDANDQEVDGEALTVTAGVFATAQGGSITINANGSYSYTPAMGFSGADSVDYMVTDGTTPDIGTLNITVGSGGSGGGTSKSIGGDSSSGSSFGYLLAVFLLPLLVLRAIREKKPKIR